MLYLLDLTQDDANLGRFLSPDNFIQDPYNTQSFNRYGYVWNNPLKYGDPSGEELITILAIGIGALVGGYLGGSIANNSFNPGDWSWNFETFAAIAGGALLGAFAGATLAANAGTLVVPASATTAVGGVPLGSLYITAAGLKFGSIITGGAAWTLASFKTKREQEEQNISDNPFAIPKKKSTVEAGDLEIVGIDQSDDVPVVSDDVINEMVPDISDSGTISFSKGVHNVNIELITYGGVSAGPLGASFGKTVISFNGQKIESLGGSTGAGLGTDFFSSVKSSTIEFHTEISGNSLADIFNLTGLITTRTIGGMVKFGEVIGFDGPNTMNKLWSARVFGAGLSAGVEGSRSSGKFGGTFKAVK